jgi:OmpA-OmpF porin, OOP family
MMTTHKDWVVRASTLGGLLLVSSIGAGCGPSTNAALERARANYAQAQQNPQISTYAPVPLQEARQSLQQAEQAWKDDKDRDEVNHLAYVTDERIAIARNAAEKKMTEAEMKRLDEERANVVISARTHEADQAKQTAQEAEDRARRLEQELADLQAKQTDRGLVLTLSDVLFEYNKADLKPGALHNLYTLVTFLKENPERNLLIEGYADSTGSDSYNLTLSQRRAEAVQNFLLQNNIPPQRMVVRGYGEDYPVATNNTEAGRQQNRRVEIVVLKEGEVAANRLR